MFPFNLESRICREGSGESGGGAGDGGHEGQHGAGVDANAGNWGSAEPGQGGAGFDTTTSAISAHETQHAQGAGTVTATSGVTSSTGGTTHEEVHDQPLQDLPTGTPTAPGAGGAPTGGAPEDGPVGGIDAQPGLDTETAAPAAAATAAAAPGFTSSSAATPTSGYTPTFTDVIEQFGPVAAPSFGEDDEEVSDFFNPLETPGALPAGTQVAYGRTGAPAPATTPAVTPAEIDAINNRYAVGNLPPNATPTQRGVMTPEQVSTPMGRALATGFGMVSSVLPGPVGPFVQGRPMGVMGSIPGPLSEIVSPINTLSSLARTVGIYDGDETRGAMRGPLTGTPMDAVNPGIFGSLPAEFDTDRGMMGRPSIAGFLGLSNDRLAPGTIPALDPATYDVGQTPAEIAAAIAAGTYAPGSPGATGSNPAADPGSNAGAGSGGADGNMVVDAMLSALGLVPTGQTATGETPPGVVPDVGQVPSNQQRVSAGQLPEFLRWLAGNVGAGSLFQDEDAPSRSAFGRARSALWAA